MAASVGESEMEVNLTPLLDLVLQLIMFFMACINFVSDQLSASVILPDSQSAQEIQPKTENEVVVINIEMLRQPKLVDGQEVINPKDNKPELELATPRTTIFRIFGGEPITFTEERKGQGLGLAMEQVRNLANNIKLRIAVRDKRRPDEIKELKVPVIIRADIETEYQMVYNLITQCKGSGFPKVELRASQPK